MSGISRVVTGNMHLGKDVVSDPLQMVLESDVLRDAKGAPKSKEDALFQLQALSPGIL